MKAYRVYHLTRTSLERALPGVLERVLQRGQRAVVRLGSAERVEHLDDSLWTYGRASFLPHGTARDGQPSEQPVWLTDGLENPNRADILLLADGVEDSGAADFALVCRFIDGADSTGLAQARAEFQRAKSAGLETHYYRQTETGWEQEAG